MILNNKDCLGIQRVVNSPKGDIDLYFQVNFNGQGTIANLKEIVATFENAFVIEENGKVDLVIRQEDGTFVKFTNLTDNVTVFDYQPNLDEHIQLYEENTKDILNSNKVVKSNIQETAPSESINKDEISTQNDELVTTFIQDTIIALSCTDTEKIYKLTTEESAVQIDEDKSQLDHGSTVPTHGTTPEAEPTPEAEKVEQTDKEFDPVIKPISEPNPQPSEVNWIDKLEINEVYHSPIYTEIKTIETDNLILEMNVGSLNIRTKR